MGDKKEAKKCFRGGCGSNANSKIIPLASLLDAKKESYPQEKTCTGCGAGKT